MGSNAACDFCVSRGRRDPGFIGIDHVPAGKPQTEYGAVDFMIGWFVYAAAVIYLVV